MKPLGKMVLLSTAFFVLILFALYSAFKFGQQDRRDSSSGIKLDNHAVAKATVDIGKPTKIEAKPSQLVAGSETNIVYSDKDKGKEINGVVEFRGVKTNLKFE